MKKRRGLPLKGYMLEIVTRQGSKQEKMTREQLALKIKHLGAK